MTVSELDTLMAQELADPNSQIWTQASERLPTLNAAQDDLVLMLLAFGSQYNKVFDLLSELQKIEIGASVGSSGFALSGVTGRHFLRNGYINSKTIINNRERWPTRITVDKLGYQSNVFMKGTDRNPKCYIFSNIYYLLVDGAASFPITTDIYYIGKPFKLGVVTAGSGKNQTVTTPDWNILLQDVIIKIAMTKCLSMRMDDKDIARINQLRQEIKDDILLLVKGAESEPQTRTSGQYIREQRELIDKQLNAGVQNA